VSDLSEAPGTTFRYIDETEIRMAELMTPDLTNFSGKVHGGAILSLMDKVAYVCACSYAGCYCVTVSVDEVEFREPVHVGELLHLTARVVQVGRSSMDVEILVEAQDLPHRTMRPTNTCWFTMVAVRDGKSVSVPELRFRTPDDEARYLHGSLRRELRAELRARRAALNSSSGS
jgi:uncharacterized protein (TIGR00369 family)